MDDNNANGNRLVLHRHQQEIEVFRKEDKERQRFKDSQKNKGQFQLSMTLSNADFYYIQEALDEKEKPLCRLLDSIRISEYQEKLYANPNLRRLLYLPDSGITFDFETHEAIMKDGTRKKVVKKTHEEVDCNHQHFEESGDEEPSDDQDQSHEGDQTEDDQGLQSSELGMKWFSSFSEQCGGVDQAEARFTMSLVLEGIEEFYIQHYCQNLDTIAEKQQTIAAINQVIRLIRNSLDWEGIDQPLIA